MQLQILVVLAILVYFFFLKNGVSEAFEQDMSYAQLQSYRGERTGYGQQVPRPAYFDNVATNFWPTLQRPPMIVHNMNKKHKVHIPEFVPHTTFTF